MTLEENMYRNFGLSYPWLQEMTMSYEPFDVFQIIITLKSGERILYDDLENSIDYITDYNDEEVWNRRFVKNLNRAIRLSGLDQERLSDLTGISKSTISRYLNGRTKPSMYNVYKIVDAAGCSINDLLRFPK